MPGSTGPRSTQHGVLAYPKLWHTPKIPGLGDVRWGAFFGALGDIGYDGHVAIEVEDRAFEGSLELRLESLHHQPPPPDPVLQRIDRLDPRPTRRRWSPDFRRIFPDRMTG